MSYTLRVRVNITTIKGVVTLASSHVTRQICPKLIRPSTLQVVSFSQMAHCHGNHMDQSGMAYLFNAYKMGVYYFTDVESSASLF